MITVFLVSPGEHSHLRPGSDDKLLIIISLQHIKPRLLKLAKLYSEYVGENEPVLSANVMSKAR